MGNYCGGCCGSSLNPNSQVQVDDYKQLFDNIKYPTDLGRLIRHVEQLLSVIAKARSAQDIQANSIKVPDSVKDIVGCGSEFLEAISKEGERLNKDISASKLPSEIKTVISKALEHVGQLHWMAVGLSVIAFVLHRMDQVPSNFDKCVQLLKKMVDLAKRLQLLHNRMPQETEGLEEAVHAIVEGAVTCCCCMSQKKLFKYLFASTDEANLQHIVTVMDELHRALILMIAMDIQGQIPRRYYPSDPEAPFGAVGIDDKIEEVIRLLDMQSKGRARAVLLYGFGGAGKTTLADCVMSKVDLRGMKYSRIQLGNKKLHEDQQDLYADLTKQPLVFKNCNDGQEKLKEVLERKPTFVLIDNALTKEEINDLLPPQLSLPFGSRMLITSRKVDVIEELRSRDIDCEVHNVEGLSPEAAIEYFRRTVVRSERITSALEGQGVSLDQIDDVAKECHGVPLLLRVYAQHLERRGSDPRVYREMLVALRQGDFSYTDVHIGERLLYVYHQLRQEDKDAFVDICTYFHGWNKDDVSYIVTTRALNTLIDGALAKIDASDKVIVHDVLKAMGIKQGGQTRVQSVHDWEKALELDKKIEGIWLVDSKRIFKLQSERLMAMKDCLRVLALGRKIRLSRECDPPFISLSYLQIDNLDDLPIFGGKLPEALRYVKIRMRQFPQCPSSVPSHKVLVNSIKDLGKLEKFSFECLQMKTFPEEFRLPATLRELELSNCLDLHELPQGLDSLTTLERLTLQRCDSLKFLPREFSKLRSLMCLRIQDCYGLQALPTEFGQLSSLKRFNLSGCSQLETLSANFGRLPSLESLKLYDLDNLVELPGSFGNLSKLSELTVSRCRSLSGLPEGLGNLSNLQSLDLSGCGSLTTLPDGLGNLSNLQSLDLWGCGSLTSLSDGLGNLSNLQSLHLLRCGSLTRLPDGLGNLSNLQSLHLSGCGSLTSLPDGLGNLSNLQSLHLSGCGSLRNLPDGLGNLSNLQSLHLSRCGSLTSLPDGLGNLSNLQSLHLGECENLTSLPDGLGNLSNLQSLELWKCGSLTSLPDGLGNLSNLQSLHLWGCGSLTSLPDGLGNLSNLQWLHLGGCENLTSLPDGLGNLSNLQSLDLSWCESLTSLPDGLGNLSNLQSLDSTECLSLMNLPDGLCNLSNLQSLDLTKCRNLTSLPDRLGNLSKLKSLNLSECGRVSTLPDGFCNMSSLQCLSLAGQNSLSKLPYRLCNLQLLKELDLTSCTNLSILSDRYGELSGLKRLKMARCSELKVLSDDFERLKAVEYLDLSDCSELEGGTMERLVKLESLQSLNIVRSTKLVMKWEEMEREKILILVQSIENDGLWEDAMRAAGAACFHNNCQLVDRTQDSVGSADFIQPGTSVAFLFASAEMEEEVFEKMENWVVSEKWQIVYVQVNEDCKEQDIQEALESLPHGSRAIAYREIRIRSIFGRIFEHYREGSWNRKLLCIADVNVDDGGSKHLVYSSKQQNLL